jgi:hypothetical protein
MLLVHVWRYGLRRTVDVLFRKALNENQQNRSARDHVQSRQVRHSLFATDACPGLQPLPSWVLRGEAGVQSVLQMIVKMERLLHLSRGPRRRLHSRLAARRACCCFVVNWRKHWQRKPRRISDPWPHSFPRLDKAEDSTLSSKTTQRDEQTTQRVAESSDALQTRRSEDGFCSQPF